MPCAGQIRPSAAGGGDFGAIVQQLLRNKRRLLLATLASLLLGLTYLWLATPMYTATASLFVDPRTRKIEEAVPGGMGSDTTLLESQVAIITSDGVLKKVVSKLNLGSQSGICRRNRLRYRARINAVFVRGNTRNRADERALDCAQKGAQSHAALKRHMFSISPQRSALRQTAAEIAQAVIDAYFDDQTETKSVRCQARQRA